MEKLSKKGLSQFCTVNLLSAPPPRDFWEVVSKGFSYAWRLYAFLQEERELVYLASNTAHIHFDWISKMSRGCLVNLTDYVADKVQSVLENPYVLIVGTKAGQKANLYGKLFAERSIPYAYLEQHEQDRAFNRLN
jgi:aspartate/glutamate racemase